MENKIALIVEAATAQINGAQSQKELNDVKVQY